jgi:small-conductance mechanosensitive channel
VSGHIRPGDYIKLDSGEEGYVTDITWRSTTIKTLDNNLIITPNAKLAQAIVTNFHLPDKPMASRVQVSVSYDTDIEEVERILLEEVKKSVGGIPGLLVEPEPAVRFSPGFGASSLDFTVIFHVAEFDSQFLIQHELRKRIFKRFRSEGIEIPFPTQTVHLHNKPRA